MLQFTPPRPIQQMYITVLNDFCRSEMTPSFFLSPASQCGGCSVVSSNLYARDSIDNNQYYLLYGVLPSHDS